MEEKKKIDLRRASFSPRNSFPLSTEVPGEYKTEPLGGMNMQRAGVFRATGKSSESNFNGKENSKVIIIISSMF